MPSYSSLVLSKNPVAYYRMNETSGTIAHDSSGNGFHATLSGTIAYSQAGAIANDTDTALQLGASAQLSFPANLNPSTWSALSLIFWINTGSGYSSVGVAVNSSGSTVYLNGQPIALGTSAAIGIDQYLSWVGSGGAATYDEIMLCNYVLAASDFSDFYGAGVAQSFIYSYGPFQINAHSGGLGYFLVAKDLDFPTYKPTLSPIARQDMWKINGWQVDARNIQVDIVVLGSSREDCLARKDALEQALSLRDQQLVLHSDGRYWVANPTTGRVKFSAGTGIVQARIPVTFVCTDPYAKAVNAASYDTGSLAYSASGNSYISPTFTVAGGGTVYTWPQIHLVHKTPSLGFTTLSGALTQGATYTSLSVASSPALTAGQILTLYFAPGGSATLNTQKVTVAATVASTATTIPVNSFTAAWPFTVGTFVYVSTAWNQVTVSQITDNYTLSLTSTSAAPLPQTLNDYLDIFCDPSTGMYIATNGLTQYLDFTGAFPPLEPGNTQWQISIAADYQPTVDVMWTWTPRYLS